MRILSLLKNLFSKEKEKNKKDKIPFSPHQLLYAGAGLEQIRDIKIKVDAIEDWLRYEGVTKSWFINEFSNETPELEKKLELILKKLENLEKKIEEKDAQPTIVLEKEKPKEFVVVKEPEKIKYEYVLTATDVEIIKHLENGPMTFTDLLKKVRFSRQTLSSHLKELIRLGRIEKERKGKFTYYFVSK